MTNARIGKELSIEAPDKIGMLAKLASAIAGAGVDIKASYAHGSEGKGYFLMLTDDNSKAMDALRPLGLEVKEQEVVLVDLEDRPGAVAEMTKKLADANINLKYFYGTSSGKADACLVVFNSDDNNRAIELLG